MLNKERVEEILIESGALLHGHFLLTSGRHSNQYMQCAKILQYPSFATELINNLYEHFKNDNIDLVIAPAIGGIIVGYELAKQLNVRSIFAERKNGEMCISRGFEIPNNARVIVVEDVITTGGTVQEVIDLVNENGGTVVGVGAIVDRSNGNIDFGLKKCTVYTADFMSYYKDNCPLCKDGNISLVKPGSRNI